MCDQANQTLSKARFQATRYLNTNLCSIESTRAQTTRNYCQSFAKDYRILTSTFSESPTWFALHINPTGPHTQLHLLNHTNITKPKKPQTSTAFGFEPNSPLKLLDVNKSANGIVPGAPTELTTVMKSPPTQAGYIGNQPAR